MKPVLSWRKIRSDKMALDVVCGMEVDETTAQWTSGYKGRTYYFCSPGCKRAFDANPEKYIKGSGEHGSHKGHEHHHH
jgi:YHS domain-containing protein